MTAGSRVWVVVPAFQAERTLAAVLRRAPRRVLDCDVNLLVVDDGSTDGTARVAREEGVEVIVHGSNLGYARAQKSGFQRAMAGDAQAVAILHADGQYPPESLAEVFEPLLRGDADVVLGTRVRDGLARARGMPWLRWAANRVLSRIENAASGLNLSEFHTGMMGYSRRALELLPWKWVSDTFHIDGELAMWAGRHGLRIAEVDVPHGYGSERSHLRPVPYVLTVLAIAAAVRVGLYDRWVKQRRRASEGVV